MGDFRGEFDERHWVVTEDGTVDCRGQPAEKQKTGGWKATTSIFAAEFAERTAAFGVAFNIVTYLVSKKHLPLTEAANMTTNVVGASYTLALLGGFLADTVLGRFWTIFSFGNFQLVGLILLLIDSSLSPFNNCSSAACPKEHGLGLVLVYFALYLIALGSGGIKSCVSAFGADQFEKEDPEEGKHLPNYFNFFFMAVTAGGLLGATVVIYIESLSWAKAFGGLAILMALSLCGLIVFRPFYRFRVPAGSPFTAIAKVIVAAIRNRNRSRPADISGFYNVIRGGNYVRVPQTDHFRILDKAAIIPAGLSEDEVLEINPWDLATVTEVEDIKLVIRLLPILATTWFFWTVDSQFVTFAVSQSTTTNRYVGQHFLIPPASVQAIKICAALVTLMAYDRVFMVIYGKLTGNFTGLTSLQRIGVGFVMPIFAMIASALAEKHRLDVVHSLGLEANPFAPLPNGPYSVFWLFPQFVLMGVGEALVYSAELDFFYNESPEHMQSLGTSMALCTIAIGFFGSNAFVSMVNFATGGENNGWLRNNLNDSRLDYFYWTLCVLSIVNLVVYMVVSSFHQYKKTDKGEEFEEYELSE